MKMKAVAARRRDLSRAVLPRPIDPRMIFALDMDDDIWQDAGLDDNDDDSNNDAPRWLGDDEMRKGI